MAEGSELPQIGVVGTLADAMLSYTSLAADMAHVRSLLTEMTARPAPPVGEADWPAVALWQAALVAYARCWGAGRRKGFVNRVPVPPEFADPHRWMLRMRDRHVAHFTRENDAEQGVVMVFLDPSQPDHPAVGAGRLLARMLYPAEGNPARLLELAGHFEAEFGRLADAASARILELAQAQSGRALLDGQAQGRGLRMNETFPPLAPSSGVRHEAGS